MPNEEGWLKVERETKFPDKWIWEENKELVGKLTDKSLAVKGRFNFYTFELEDKREVSVLGTKILDDFLQDMTIGTMVKIVYLGEIELKNGNTMKDFEVFKK
jgi:hypothetical protein